MSKECKLLRTPCNTKTLIGGLESKKSLPPVLGPLGAGDTQGLRRATVTLGLF
jgi:hypothetical protein